MTSNRRIPVLPRQHAIPQEIAYAVYGLNEEYAYEYTYTHIHTCFRLTF